MDGMMQDANRTEAVFRLSATEADVRAALIALRAQLADWQLGDDLCGRAELVLAEALNNVAEHAFAPEFASQGVAGGNAGSVADSNADNLAGSNADRLANSNANNMACGNAGSVAGGKADSVADGKAESVADSVADGAGGTTGQSAGSGPDPSAGDGADAMAHTGPGAMADGGSVSHAAEASDAICLTLRCTPEALRVRLVDQGRAMPGLTLPEGKLPRHDVALEDLPEGGFGWFLIHNLTQRLTYRRIGAKNQLDFEIPLSEV